MLFAFGGSVLSQLQDWGRQFPEEKLKSVQEKNALKTFATPEVSCFGSSVWFFNTDQ